MHKCCAKAVSLAITGSIAKDQDDPRPTMSAFADRGSKKPKGFGQVEKMLSQLRENEPGQVAKILREARVALAFAARHQSLGSLISFDHIDER